MPERTLTVVSEYIGTREVAVPDGGKWETNLDLLTVWDRNGDMVAQIREWKSVEVTG